MPVTSVNFGSGWLYLAASDERSNDLDVLYLSRGAGETMYFHNIHVPLDMRQRSGELIAIPLVGRDAGDRVAIGEGMLIPHDRGIRLVSPHEPSKNKLRIRIIQQMRKVWVNLRFVADA
ncbi:hypothetical protein A3A38_00715 [Candidatus Kaiserbacteria bacterium RIFCSPLOWO2_01_FULL_53_17]|uniref:Uncharacterized protein n=1 Tax=Candidatus Kaiserbacteria bacterium RIFCSPLOWO2_01_FULL_53_17 TaxID=1798511 RepID=A0A1F6EGC4_9BACT|nr:MAG: hypothetical protein A3A38_00715 [Candidatus Kaiserbacteria bacterium RIFCSPLOWO2_01_FULL_53_17]